jgi:hypothetical protein
MGPLILRALVTPAGIGGLAGAILAALLAVQTGRLHHAKSDLVQARHQLIDPGTGRGWRAEAEDNAKAAAQLSATLDKQSHSLEALRAVQDQVTAASTEALTAATALSRQDRALASRALAERPSSDICGSADALIVQSLEAVHR